MNQVSTSSLRYFQRWGRGRHNGRDYQVLQRKDPFRSGQVAFDPRPRARMNTIERMISKPCATIERFRNFY